MKTQMVTPVSKSTQNLKERNPLLVKILAVVLLVVLCCSLPSLLFLPLCMMQDFNIPQNTEVIVSACKRPSATGVPGGEVLFVREGLTDKIYLLDLRTGEKRDVPNDPLLLDHGIFLSSELVWLEGSLVGPDDPNYRPHYILDLTDGQRYQLLDLNWLPRLSNGTFDSKYYVYFQPTELFFIHHSKNTLIALSPDFRGHPEGRVILSQYALESGVNAEHGKLLEQLMKNLGVNYGIADLSTTRYADIPSPTGKYVVRNDGIYLLGTNMPVLTRQYTGGLFMGGYFKSWYYDESGVVVQEGTRYLISSSLLGSYYPIPTPILKLRLPAP